MLYLIRGFLLFQINLDINLFHSLKSLGGGISTGYVLLFWQREVAQRLMILMFSPQNTWRFKLFGGAIGDGDGVHYKSKLVRGRSQGENSSLWLTVSVGESSPPSGLLLWTPSIISATCFCHHPQFGFIMLGFGSSVGFPVLFWSCLFDFLLVPALLMTCTPWFGHQ